MQIKTALIFHTLVRMSNIKTRSTISAGVDVKKGEHLLLVRVGKGKATVEISIDVPLKS